MPSEKSYFSDTEVLHMVYFANFQSMTDYGIIFWGNSASSSQIFWLQKKIIRIMEGVSPKFSSRGLFRTVDILTFPRLCIFLLMLLLLNNFNNFHTNSSVHESNTRYKYQIQRPVVKLTCYQRGVYYSGITIFSSLPSGIYNLKNTKFRFRPALQSSVAIYSLYYIKEFSAYIKNINWYLCLLIYSYIHVFIAIILKLMMWIHSTHYVSNKWLFKCISHVNCLLYIYGLYVLFLTGNIYNHKYGYITYRAAVQCVYFLTQAGITITCSLLTTVYYICCVQIQVLHATCKILHYQQPILFVRNSSNIELKKEKHKSHNPWLLSQSVYWDKTWKSCSCRDT